MTHDDDFLYLEHLHSEFQRGGYAVMPRRRLKRRDHRRNIADDKYFTRIDIKNLRGINPAVRTGDDHDLGLLPVAQIGPAIAVRRPAQIAKAVISGNQPVKLWR